MSTSAICGFDECARPAFARGYCNGHLHQLRSGKSLRPLMQRSRPGSSPEACSFDGCGRPHAARGWCTTHYMQIVTDGVAREARKFGHGCSEDGCPNTHYGRGLCRAHWTAMRRGVVRENTFIVLDSDLRRLAERHRGRCAYCLVAPFEHWDHVIPVARGGRHSIGNLLPSCARCNLKKQAKFVVEFRVRYPEMQRAA